MAEKTAPQFNSHISFSAGKIALQSYFRKRGMGRGWMGRKVEGEREGAGNSTI